MTIKVPNQHVHVYPHSLSRIFAKTKVPKILCYSASLIFFSEDASCHVLNDSLYDNKSFRKEDNLNQYLTNVHFIPRISIASQIVVNKTSKTINMSCCLLSHVQGLRETTTIFKTMIFHEMQFLNLLEEYLHRNFHTANIRHLR